MPCSCHCLSPWCNRQQALSYILMGQHGEPAAGAWLCSKCAALLQKDLSQWLYMKITQRTRNHMTTDGAFNGSLACVLMVIWESSDLKVSVRLSHGKRCSGNRAGRWFIWSASHLRQTMVSHFLYSFWLKLFEMLSISILRLGLCGHFSHSAN